MSICSCDGRTFEETKNQVLCFKDYENGEPVPGREEALSKIKSGTCVPELFSNVKAALLTGGGGIGVPVLTEPIAKTIEIADLQDEIDALPKILMANVTFIVNSGTYEGEILIEGFAGSGILTINGASVAGQITHNISNMVIRNCSNPKIVVQGFTGTSTPDTTFYAFRCFGINLIYCNTTDTFHGHGVTIAETPLVLVQGCKISNKHVAIRVANSRVKTIDLTGTNNATIYNAANCGIIHKENAGTISGTTVNSYGLGGLIINPSGGTIGS